MIESGIEKKTQHFSWLSITVVVAASLVLKFIGDRLFDRISLAILFSFLPPGIFFHEPWKDAVLYGSIMGLFWGFLAGILGLLFAFIRRYTDKTRFALWCLGIGVALHFFVEVVLFAWPSLF